MQVYLKPIYGTMTYKGHCVTLPHNFQRVAYVFPNCPEDLAVVVFTVKGENGHGDSDFRVRRKRVLEALFWLKETNPLYKNIFIDTVFVAG